MDSPNEWMMECIGDMSERALKKTVKALRKYSFRYKFSTRHWEDIEWRVKKIFPVGFSDDIDFHAFISTSCFSFIFGLLCFYLPIGWKYSEHFSILKYFSFELSCLTMAVLSYNNKNNIKMETAIINESLLILGVWQYSSLLYLADFFDLIHKQQFRPRAAFGPHR